MTYNAYEIIYVLTKEDVATVAKKIGIDKLTGEHYRMAQKFLESFCGEGAYTWSDAIADGLREADERLRDG